jgi:hypothetical protein
MSAGGRGGGGDRRRARERERPAARDDRDHRVGHAWGRGSGANAEGSGAVVSHTDGAAVLAAAKARGPRSPSGPALTTGWKETPLVVAEVRGQSDGVHPAFGPPRCLVPGDERYRRRRRADPRDRATAARAAQPARSRREDRLVERPFGPGVTPDRPGSSTTTTATSTRSALVM